MTLQPSLFDVLPSTPQPTPSAPHNRTETSAAAARSVVASGEAGRQLLRVLEAIRHAGARGTTRKDIAHRLGIVESTVCARVSTLLRQGLIFEAPKPRTPDHDGNKRQKVVVAVEFAPEHEARGEAQ